MNIRLRVITDINLMKRKLRLRAKAKGLYENFGQKEVRQLEDKYVNYRYSDSEVWGLISKFNDWCMLFNDSDLRG